MPSSRVPPVAAERNELLKPDRGMYILLDGKWTAANRDGEMPKDEANVGTTRCRLDAEQGRRLVVEPR